MQQCVQGLKALVPEVTLGSEMSNSDLLTTRSEQHIVPLE